MELVHVYFSILLDVMEVYSIIAIYKEVKHVHRSLIILLIYEYIKNLKFRRPILNILNT